MLIFLEILNLSNKNDYIQNLKMVENYRQPFVGRTKVEKFALHPSVC